MAQKNATPTADQRRILERHGLRAVCWTVVKELQHSMIVKHRITGEFKLVEKGEAT